MTPLRDRTLAAVSHLWECSLAENLRRISAWELPIRQVGLLFYERETSLGYAPEEFSNLVGLSAHAHLPMDLPWEAGAKAVWDIICRLMEKPSACGATGFLSSGKEDEPCMRECAPLAHDRNTGRNLTRPEGKKTECQLWGGVLHPPAEPRLLAGVAGLWRKAGPGWRLMVENIPSQDLRVHWPVIRDMDLPVCLDVGHLMAFGQEWLLDEPGLPGRVELVHCYAPGRARGVHVHLPLSELTGAQAVTVRRILDMAPATAPILFEIFSYAHLLDSLERFYQLDAGGENRK